MLEDLMKVKKMIVSFYSPTNSSIGTAPGDISLKSDQYPPLKMKLINYNEEIFSSAEIDDVANVAEFQLEDIISWLIIRGFGENDFLEKLKQNLGFHGLTLEDILNRHHPPKLEISDNSIFVILRIVSPSENSFDSTLSLVIEKTNVYLFSPTGGFPLSSKLIKRIETKRGAIRRKGVDYLLFAIIDLVIDSYFPKIDLIAKSIKEIDQNIFENQDPHLLKEIKSIRQVLNICFDNLLPLRDIIERLINDDSGFVKEDNHKYYNHALSHVSFLCDRITRLKESTSDIMNLNISMNGQKMNEIMKVLTMMSSIFIPLSFICGLYGMNFDSSKSPYNMPELSFYYGYPAVVAFMFIVISVMLYYFHKKRWF